MFWYKRGSYVKSCIQYVRKATTKISSSNPSRKADTSPSTDSWQATPVKLLRLPGPSSLRHASVPLTHSYQNLHYTWASKENNSHLGNEVTNYMYLCHMSIVHKMWWGYMHLHFTHLVDCWIRNLRLYWSSLRKKITLWKFQ